MRKSGKNKALDRKKKSNAPTSSASTVNEDKRNTLKSLRNYGLTAVVVAGAGTYLYQAYQADLEERDLTKIGKGKASIVQIHDPNCPVCNALQKATRAALSNVESEKLQYLVANIKTAQGQQFANQHNVPHVTLLLFDKRGKLENILQGVRQEEELTTVFNTLAQKR